MKCYLYKKKLINEIVNKKQVTFYLQLLQLEMVDHHYQKNPYGWISNSALIMTKIK